MDATHTPILSLWADAAPAGDARPRGVPARIDALAAVATSPVAALAAAVAAHPGRDVLLMHADARLPAEGWRRLSTAWRDGDWDVLSARIAAIEPDVLADADARAWTHAEHATRASRGWRAQCSLWRAEAAAVAGNDALPLRCGELPCLLVAAADGDAPADDARGAVFPREEVVLHVLHSWGGGAERFVRDLIAGDGERAHLVLVAHNERDVRPLGTRLALYADLDAEPLRTWTLHAPIADTAEQSADVRAILAQLIPEWGIGAVLVSSLIGHSLDVLRTGLPTAVCTHDAYPLWPLLHDERDPRSDPFDGGALAAGLAAAGDDVLAGGRDAAGWRRLRDAYLEALTDANARMISPSRHAAERLCALEPELCAFDWKIAAHGLAPFASTPRPPAPADTVAARAADAPLRVLVPGRIHGGKGERLLAAMLPALPAGVELVLLGSGHAGARFEHDPRVTVIRDYVRDDLPAWIARLQPDLALLPSTVPETFSYTLSEMQALGLPLLCAAPGAPVERLRLGGGRVVAADAGAVNAELARLAADRAAIATLHAPALAQPDPVAMADQWRLLLPVAPSPLHLPAADAAALRLLASDDARRGLAADLDARTAALQAALADLDSRARWAADLQAQIDAAVAQLAVAQRELDGRADWAHDLEFQVEQARAQLARDQQAMTTQAAAIVDLERKLAAQDEARVLRAGLAESNRRYAEAVAAAQRQAADADARIADLDAALLKAQRELRDLHRRLVIAEDNELEISRLEDYVLSLDHQLAEAHGYYQADTTDLARQRDVAISQRDQAAGELAKIHASLPWRLTAWPRAWLSKLSLHLLVGRYREQHLRQLVARGFTSLRMRGVAGTWRRIRERRHSQGPDALLPAAPASATTGGDAIGLRLPATRTPRASIVVPVYNQLRFSLACLRALADCGDRASFEVIVVDDGSSDATARVLPSIPGVRYHRNAENLGFVGACNAGAELARGEFLVFLNNDTTVQPGWLDALLATFADFADTGLAGSKLVYPDGRLQEAGGIVFADGSGWNYGRFEDPEHPNYNFVREVDYCSGAAIAIRRPLFLQLGGFDTLFSPAYYEDTDLAMRVRRHGLKVRYQPASVVVHHEGITAGTDTREGVKAFQVANQGKFLERWGAELAATHRPPGTNPEIAADRGRGPGRRVLVLDACTPTPDRDSGSLRMLALMRVLRDEGCSVVFFAENRAHDGRYTTALQRAGVEAWWHPHIADVPRWLAQHGAGFDLVIGSRHYVLSPLLPLLRRFAPQAHLVFDTVDLHHLREQREAELSDDPARWKAAARTRRIELALIRQCDSTWVVSPAEKTLLAAELPEARVEVVSNIHDAAGLGPDWAQRSGLMFVGSYRHPPNVDAARWLCDEILPHIRAQLPDVELHLVGGDAPDEVRALGERRGVRFHGYVPDLLPLLEGVRVGLAPLRYGAGVKGKVNHSLAHGQPVVATTCAVEGMHLVDGVDVLVADDAPGFAAAVVRLYGDAALWQRLAEGGLENTRRHFSPEPVRATLRALLASLPTP